MHPLSTKFQLFCEELNFDELHLQGRVLGAYWRPVHTVRGRKVQGVDWSSRLHRMCRRHVFSSPRGLRVITMPPLFVILLVASRELNLHLQCGLLGVYWRNLHNV